MAARALAARAGSSVVLSSVVAPGAVRAVALRQPTSLGALQMGSRRMVSGNSGPATVYQTFFKSNRMYITFVVCGAIVLTGVGNAVLDGVWAAKNRGVSHCCWRCYDVHCAAYAPAPRGVAHSPTCSQ